MAWNVQLASGQELAVLPNAAMVHLGHAHRQPVHTLVAGRLNHRANSPEHGIGDVDIFHGHHGDDLRSRVASLSAFGDESGVIQGCSNACALQQCFAHCEVYGVVGSQKHRETMREIQREREREREREG